MSSAQALTAGIHSQKRQAEPQPVQNKVEKSLPLDLETIEAEAEKSTLGQRVADGMASKVGSWGFLIGQSVVLTGWIGMNLMPGVPHWDSSPFILLNLVFFFDETQVNETKVTELSNLQQQPDFNGIKLVGSNFLNQYPVYVPLNISQPIENDSKVIEGIYVSLNH